MKAKVQDTEHGYIKACGMAVDYDTVLTREQPAPNKAQHSTLPWFTMAQPKADDLHPMVSVWAGSETRENIVCNSCSPTDARLIVRAANYVESLAGALEDCITTPGALAERSHEYALRRLASITETAKSALAAYNKAKQARKQLFAWSSNAEQRVQSTIKLSPYKDKARRTPPPQT